jgi:hypothetical protein
MMWAVTLVYGAVEVRPLAVVTTRLGAFPSSRRCREGLLDILYYINYFM